MLYMVTFTINIPQMLAYIPCMDPMGNGMKQPDPAVNHCSKPGNFPGTVAFSRLPDFRTKTSARFGHGEHPTFSPKKMLVNVC